MASTYRRQTHDDLSIRTTPSHAQLRQAIQALRANGRDPRAYRCGLAEQAHVSVDVVDQLIAEAK